MAINPTDLQITVIKVVSDNERAPVYRAILADRTNGYATVGEAGLWFADDKDGNEKTDKNGNPFLRGKVAPPRDKS